jgi:branched-chain amino acid aminotransferase
MTDSLICWNGRIMPASEVAISPLDHGVLLGDGLFETMRAYRGRVFRLDAHLARLAASASVIHLSLPGSIAELGACVTATLQANNLAEAVLRLTVLRGVGPPGPDPRGCGEPNSFITARPFVAYPERCYTAGAAAVIATTRQNEGSPLSRLKSLSYLNHVLARVEAREAGVDEVLLMNNRGEIAEGSVSNLFVVRQESVLTPSVECGCLPGITRAAVLEEATRLGIPAIEQALSPAELYDADEAFLTNSVMELMPLVRVGDRSIGKGRPGPVTKQLAAAYRAVVDVETSA